MATYFISDLHLPMDTESAASRLFATFLEQQAEDIDALYILGDLVEVWMGDDMGRTQYASLMRQFRGLTKRGVMLYLMRGNHDFLMSKEMVEELGAELLDDVGVIELYGRKTLVCHGDTLCTLDVDYQNMRTQFRSALWQEHFLTQPAQSRAEFVGNLIERSAKAVGKKSTAEMDVVQSEVEALMSQHQADVLIHGHTHLPGVHDFSIKNQARQRVVLGAWQQEGEILRWDQAGFALRPVREYGAGT